MLLDAMESEQATPSLSQAQRLKRFSQEGNLTPESMRAIMSEEKKPEKSVLDLDDPDIKRFFKESYTPQKRKEIIIKALEHWQKRQHAQER